MYFPTHAASDLVWAWTRLWTAKSVWRQEVSAPVDEFAEWLLDFEIRLSLFP